MSLGQRVKSAVGWSTGLKVGFQAVTWAMTLLVIRILSPDDYGLMALSQMFVAALTGFSDVGLGDALVQRQDTPRPLIASVFGLLLVISGGLTLLLVLAAYPIAAWYHDDRLVRLIQVASLNLLISGLVTIPRVFLQKSLRIRPMFLMEMAAGITGTLCVIGLAYSGWGVWALMLGVVTGSVVRLIGFAVLTAEYWVWPSFDFRPVRPLLSFGAFSMLEYVAWVCFTSSDVLVIGRLLGPESLGLYSVALNFAAMPLTKIAPIINQVAFPAFALVQGNPSEARFYALKAMRIMAGAMVPIFFGISAVAPEIVGLVFGSQWVRAEPMLALLAPAMSFRAILLVFPLFLAGIGDARAGFSCTAIAAVLFPPAFVVGCHWGIMGVCTAWVVLYPVVFAIASLIAMRRGRLPLGELLQIPVRPIVAGLVMLAAVTALRPYMPELVWLRAALLVAAGAAAYLSVMALAFRSSLMELVNLVLRRHAAG